MSAKDVNNVIKKYENVPPDGGWGYMIAVAVIILGSTSTAFVSSYSLLFKEFLRDIGRSSTDAALMPSLAVTCTAIAGFLTNPLLSLMSHRKLSLVAVLIFNTGVICILFVKSVFTFNICYGILQGLGLGFMYNLSCSILNDYFVKRPLMIISLIQSVVAVASMMAPLLIKWSLERHGFRDTMILLSGLTLHNFIAVTLMQPAKWHMKKVEVDSSNEKFLPDKEQKEEPSAVPIIKLTNADGNLSNVNDKLYLAAENDDTGIKYRKIVNLLFDKSLYEGFLLSCICAGPALALFADTTYSSILSQALITAGWMKDNVALANTLYSIGDLVMRLLFLFLSNWLHKLGSQELYVLGVTLGLVSRLGMLWSKSYIAIMIYISLVGASHCAVTILVPLVVGDAVPAKKFTSALGILMMLSGIVNLVLGPAIGAVKDLSESYGPVFYLIASCLAIIVLFWSIEMCYKKNKHKRMQRREYLRQKKLNK